MSDENNNGRNSAPGGRQPLTLKPRAGGSVSAGTVKQSFSHGRTKTVVVETKRARPHAAPAGNLAAPSPNERRVFEPAKPAAPPAGQAPRAPQAPNDGLSPEERAARQRAIELARQQQAKQEAERRAREERARAEAEAARAAQAAQAAPPPAPKAEA
uniref:IF-2-associated domain-containing protein n=1 Tax=Phenylobacterium sp. TaxID=1871053 RepID=UPI00281160FC